MPRPKQRELQKVTLNLFEGDFEILQSTYRDIGASKVVRTLVRAHIESLEANVKADPTQLEIEGL